MDLDLILALILFVVFYFAVMFFFRLLFFVSTLFGVGRCPACKGRDALSEDVSARRSLGAPDEFEFTNRCRYCGHGVLSRGTARHSTLG
jgi:hypothetical protein